MKTIRIGSGAGFAGDRIEPAADLAKRGNLDYLIFECLAERTIALAQGAKTLDPAKGYDVMLERRFKAVLADCVANNTKIITNMGAANPLAAAKATQEVARSLGIGGLKIAAVMGDDVFDQILVSAENGFVDCMEGKIATKSILSANAYLGASPVVEALTQGADIVITGRIGDPAMFLAPLMFQFGWGFDEWEKLGQGTLYGHLLECAGQISGGYFADAASKSVPDLANIGFPYIDVTEDGVATISKLPDTGGLITRATCTEQLLYEIHDPECYFQPDVIADFSKVDFIQLEENKVQVIGGSGHPKTGSLKISVGYEDSWIGEGEISYAGPLAIERAQMAIDIMKQRLKSTSIHCEETRCDLIGVNSVLEGVSAQTENIPEVRMRFAARCNNQEAAERIGEEVEGLYINGPSGGGGVRRSARKVIAVASTFIEIEQVQIHVEILET
jgi:acyclic terpene utilization AtuA family protein